MKKLWAALKAWKERVDADTPAIYVIRSAEYVDRTGWPVPTEAEVRRDIAALLRAAGGGGKA